MDKVINLILVISMLIQGHLVTLKRIQSIETKNYIIRADDKYIVSSKIDRYGESSVINVIDGSIKIIDNDYIERATIFGDTIYYITGGMRLKEYNYVSHLSNTIHEFSENENRFLSELFILDGCIIFSTGLNIYKVSIKNKDILVSIKSDLRLSIFNDNFFYCTGSSKVVKVDSTSFNVIWESYVYDMGISYGLIDLTTGRQDFFFFDNKVVFLIFDCCDTMSTYIKCVDINNGNLVWYKRFGGTLDYIDLVKDSFIIIDSGENGALYRISLVNNELSKIADFPWIAKPKYLYGQFIIYSIGKNLFFRSIVNPKIFKMFSLDVINYAVNNKYLFIKTNNSIETYEIIIK